MSGSNGNENTAAPGHPEQPRARRVSSAGGAHAAGFANFAALRDAILRAERGTPAGAAGAPAGSEAEALLESLLRARREGSASVPNADPEPLLRGGSAAASGGSARDTGPEALLRARRDGAAQLSGEFTLAGGSEPLPRDRSAASGGFALAGGPYAQRSPDDVPLRSRNGGVNKPRAAVPTPLLAAEAVRMVDSAHSKRARMVSAIGLPAVFLAATGVAVMPTVANAASPSSSTPAASSTDCAPGSNTVANPAAKAGAPTASSSSGSSSGSAKTDTPAVPLPTSGSTSAPAAKPSSAPFGGATTPAKAAPTTAPTAPAPTSTKTSAPPAAPSSTPSPSPSSTWWDPLGWLGTTVNGIFNPAPTSSSSSSTVNKLSAAPAADPATTPSSTPTPILSIGLGGSSSSPSTPPSSKPSSDPASLPTTPQPTSSGSSAPTSSASAPSSDGSGVPTYDGHTLTPPSTVCVQAAADQPFREVEWHLNASSLTLTNQKFLGFQQIQTGDGKTVTVMAIHADDVDLTDMVTYNEDGNTRVYSDGGKGKTVHLTNVTLHVLQQKGTLVAPLPAGPVTLGPPGEAGDDLMSQAVMALLQLNLPLPPSVFTNVSVDQYTMTSDTLDIPHFNVGLTNTEPAY